MPELFTQTVGPTACAAATETRIGGVDIEIPTRQTGFTLTNIALRWANVAEDLSAVGILEIKINTVNGPFKFLVGNGIGGATGAVTPPPEDVPINIPVGGGSKVGIYCTFPNATVGMTAELQYTNGKNGKITYSDMPALVATLGAAARTTLGTVTLLPGQWTLTKLRFGIGAIVDALARSTKLELTGGSIVAAEHVLAVGMGGGSAATGMIAPAEVKRLEIAQSGMVTLTVWATAQNASLHAGYSLQYE